MTTNKPRKPMTPAKVEEMVACALLNHSVRTTAARSLKAEHFNKAGEQYLRTLWQAVSNLHEQYPPKKRKGGKRTSGKIPHNVLYSECADLADTPEYGLADQQRVELLGSAEHDGVDGLLAYAYNTFPVKHATSDWGTKLLGEFLYERSVSTPFVARIAMANRTGEVITDFEPMFAQVRSAAQAVESLVDDPWESMYRDVSEIKPLPISPTGLAWLDEPFEGGTAPPEVVGILGPTGGGKSTLIGHIAVSRAKVFVSDHEDGKPLKKAMLFTFEDDFKNRCWPRMIAAVADVKRSSILKGPSSWSTTGNLKPYELKMFKDMDPDTAPGEAERIAGQMSYLKDALGAVSMLGGGRGMGGIPEIVDLIRRSVDKDGIEPGVVFIDSLDLMVGNQLIREGVRDITKTLQLRLVSAIFELRTLIGAEFGVDVWTTNQLAAAQTKRVAGSQLHHSDATNAKGWANALDFHLLLGNMTPDTNVAVLQCTKARRTRHDDWSAVLHLDGDFGRWEDTSDSWTIHNGKLVQTSTVNQFSGAKTFHAAQQPTSFDAGLDASDFLD